MYNKESGPLWWPGFSYRIETRVLRLGENTMLRTAHVASSRTPFSRRAAACHVETLCFQVWIWKQCVSPRREHHVHKRLLGVTWKQCVFTGGFDKTCFNSLGSHRLKITSECLQESVKFISLISAGSARTLSRISRGSHFWNHSNGSPPDLRTTVFRTLLRISEGYKQDYWGSLGGSPKDPNEDMPRVSEGCSWESLEYLWMTLLRIACGSLV